MPIANSRPRRNRPILLSTKTVSRLARSWAEIARAWPIARGQSTVPRANSRPRRSRHTSSSGKVDPGAVDGASTRSFNARSREIRVAENPSHIRDLTAVRCRPLHQIRGQDDKTTLTTLQIVIMPYEPTARVATRRIRINRRRSVGGAQRIRG